MTQTQQLVDQLKAIHPEQDLHSSFLYHKRNRLTHVGLRKLAAGESLSKEIQTSLLAGEVDMAVHSLKDIPAKLATKVCARCVSQREDVRVLDFPSSWPDAG